jgi:hypothetical protein
MGADLDHALIWRDRFAGVDDIVTAQIVCFRQPGLSRNPSDRQSRHDTKGSARIGAAIRPAREPLNGT